MGEVENDRSKFGFQYFCNESKDRSWMTKHSYDRGDPALMKDFVLRAINLAIGTITAMRYRMAGPNNKAEWVASANGRRIMARDLMATVKSAAHIDDGNLPMSVLVPRILLCLQDSIMKESEDHYNSKRIWAVAARLRATLRLMPEAFQVQEDLTVMMGEDLETLQAVLLNICTNVNTELTALPEGYTPRIQESRQRQRVGAQTQLWLSSSKHPGFAEAGEAAAPGATAHNTGEPCESKRHSRNVRANEPYHRRPVADARTP